MYRFFFIFERSSFNYLYLTSRFLLSNTIDIRLTIDNEINVLYVCFRTKSSLITLFSYISLDQRNIVVNVHKRIVSSISILLILISLSIKIFFIYCFSKTSSNRLNRVFSILSAIQCNIKSAF